MRLARRTVCVSALLAVAMAAGGCVSSSVTSRRLSTPAAPAQRLLVIVQGGSFSSTNIAGKLGQKNLDMLVPSLVRRLPAVLSAHGLPTRAEQAALSSEAGALSAKLAPSESLLILTPASASYNSRTGQELLLSAQLWSETGRLVPAWQASIRLSTMGFGAFDDKLADELAMQLLGKLRGDRVAAITPGALNVE